MYVCVYVCNLLVILPGAITNLYLFTTIPKGYQDLEYTQYPKRVIKLCYLYPSPVMFLPSFLNVSVRYVTYSQQGLQGWGCSSVVASLPSIYL